MRIRARDAAGNVEPWPSDPDWDSTSLIYKELCKGSVLDARAAPVAGARILGPLNPDLPFVSGANGAYEIYAFEPLDEVSVRSDRYAAQPPALNSCRLYPRRDLVLTSQAERVRNGGFEDGLQGWQVVGAQSDVQTTADSETAHTGSGCLLLGANTALVTHAIAQAITVPAADEKPTLSFLMRSFDPESHYDRVQATVTESGSIASQVLDLHYGQTDRWTHAWADLGPWAGKQVTLTLELHIEPVDGRDPMLLDEVSVAGWHTPRITSVTGPGGMSGTVTVTGENFEPGAVARLDDVPLATTYIDDTELTAELPVGAQRGLHPLWVTNPGGEAALAGLRIGWSRFLPFAPVSD